MLSNAYFVAKFRFDTAENEPAKNLQNFRKMHFSKMHFSKMHFGGRSSAEARPRSRAGAHATPPAGRPAPAAAPCARLSHNGCGSDVQQKSFSTQIGG